MGPPVKMLFVLNDLNLNLNNFKNVVSFTFDSVLTRILWF